MQLKFENVIDKVKSKWEDMLNEEVLREEITSAFQIAQTIPKCVFKKYVHL